MPEDEVLIVGGGLAGLISAIHLAEKGANVRLIEKKAFPFHKFCGEYLSQEVLPYLNSLGLNPKLLGARSIGRFQLSDHTGKYVESKLPLGGFGIRRYSLDHAALKKARELGVHIVEQQEVQQIRFEKGIHHITCKDSSRYKARIIIGAYGKRSVLDKNLGRAFFKKPSTFLGVKQYFTYAYPPDLVSLHNFEGGYCGMAQMEDNSLNLCYLSRKETLQKYGTIENLEKQVLSQNVQIRKVLQEGKPLLKKRMVISNISFEPKELITDHILMFGDAAGMIFPLCGNGMAMAIHGGKIGVELILDFLSGQMTRTELEQAYRKQWTQEFARRLAWGRSIQPLMGKKGLSAFSIRSLKIFPGLLPAIITQTHGKPVYGIS